MPLRLRRSPSFCDRAPTAAVRSIRPGSWGPRGARWLWATTATLFAVVAAASAAHSESDAENAAVARAPRIRVVLADGTAVPGVTVAVPRLAANDVPSPWFLGAETLDATSAFDLPKWARDGSSPLELLYVRGGGFPFFSVATAELRPTRLASAPGRPLRWEVGSDVSVRRPRADLVTSRSASRADWTLRWREDVVFVRAVARDPDGAPARSMRIVDLAAWEPYRDAGDGSFAIVRPRGDAAPVAVTADGLPTTYVDSEAIAAAAAAPDRPLVVQLTSGRSTRVHVNMPGATSAARSEVTVWVWDTRHPVLQQTVTLPADGNVGPIGPGPVEIAAQTTGPDGETLLGRVTATPGHDPVEIDLWPSAWRYADARDEAPGVRFDDGTIGGEQPGAAAWSVCTADGTGGSLSFPTSAGKALRVRPGRYEIRRTAGGSGAAQRFPCEVRDGVDVVFTPPRRTTGR